MDPKKIIMGKKALIVDDEKDVLEVLVELLELCKIDTASSYDEAMDLLERYDYDVVILDIMGVRGFDLLEMTTKKRIPTLMLTAHALTEENLKKSAESGASYYVPKDEINQIATFVADVLDAKEKKRNPWVRWMDRLGGYFDVAFTGPDWREREKEFWDKKIGEE
jgi:CheY-like chemotaxis protein